MAATFCVKGHSFWHAQRSYLMLKLKHLTLAALVASGAALAATAPANAAVGISIGIGGPAYYGYDYYRPCRFYFDNHFPAPQRCYDEFRGFYGPGVYISDGFVFGSRYDYGRWSRRDDFRHWRSHDWNRDRHDNDRGGNWNGHDRDHDGDRDRHHHDHDYDNH